MIDDPSMALIERFGDRFDPQVFDETAAHWASRLSDGSLTKTPCIEDVAYGDHPRQRLDLYPVKGSGAAVVLFVHGGGFTGGDKRVRPPFYANVGRYFAAHGIMAACMTYRLAPAAAWPAGAEDVEAAARWLAERADLYGGDPQRVVVLGQSAGACHAATWLLHPRFGHDARQRICAAILMSGFYRAAEPLTPGQRAYFGEAAEGWVDRSVLTHAMPLALPLLITQADHDPAYLREQTQQLVAALAGDSALLATAEFKGHNHVSPLMTLGSENDDIGVVLRRFISEASRMK